MKLSKDELALLLTTRSDKFKKCLYESESVDHDALIRSLVDVKEVVDALKASYELPLE